MEQNLIPSAFVPVNETLGGYAPGTIAIVRTLDNPNELEAPQDFIVEEIRHAGINDVRTLAIALDMSREEFCKALIFDPEQEKLVENAEALDKAPVYVGSLEDRKEKNIRTLTEYLCNYTEKLNFRLVIINSIDEILPEITEKQSIPSKELLNALSTLAEEKGIAFLLTDYLMRLSTPYPRPDNITEIELKTDLNGIVQAMVVNNKVYRTVQDIHRKPVVIPESNNKINS